MALRETDLTTGLYTRGFLVAFGARELAFAREKEYPLSLITVSIDRTDSPDSTPGTEVDPERLKHLGNQIKKIAGEGSIVARTGAGEIAVLLPGIGSGKATRIAGRIKKKLTSTKPIYSGAKSADIAVGIASATSEISGFTELVRASRMALEPQ